MNDYFHFTEHDKTLEAKLTQMTLQNGKYVKTELEWTKAGRRCLRHLVTFDLYSLLWAGFLERLRLKKESVAADYLGPQGLATYTVQGTLRTFKQRYNVQCHEDDLDKVMLFSPHWSGFGGILRGTDCGDEPIEAFHVPWQAQLGVLGSDAEGVQVLATMQ